METRLEKLNTIEKSINEEQIESVSLLNVNNENQINLENRGGLLLPKEEDLEQEILALEKSQEVTNEKARIVREISEILEKPSKKTIIKELDKLFKKLQIHQMTDYQNIGSEILAINN